MTRTVLVIHGAGEPKRRAGRVYWEPLLGDALGPGYVRALSGWQRATVTDLRAAVIAGAKLDEVIKWGNLVYLSNGPVAVIRAEGERVLLGFWRGRRLREIEERLKPGGKYEMATLTLREGESVSAAVVKRLAREAARLNRALGDPTDI